MPEGMNVEIAHKLAESGTESESDPTPKRSPHDWLIEIAEAVVLSLIAVTTAWCGYHAAKWDGRQSFLYGTSARLRVEASVAAIEGGQRRLLDVVTFNTWIRLKEVKDDKVAATYVRRFNPSTGSLSTPGSRPNHSTTRMRLLDPSTCLSTATPC